MAPTPPILEYQFSTFPSQLQVSTPDTEAQGRIDVSVSSGATPKYCSIIRIAIPLGTDPTEFGPGPLTASVSSAKWTLSDHDIVPASTFGLNTQTQYARFTFNARDATAYKIDYNLVFSVQGAVNQSIGSFGYLVQETSGTSSTNLTPKQGTFPLTKVTPFFYLENLVTTTTTAPLVPASQFANSTAIRLAWESNGTWFQVFEKGNTTPLYSGPNKTFTVPAGAATDTTYYVQAAVTQDPAGDTASFEPIYLYESATVTITNPDLTPNSSIVTGNFKAMFGADVGPFTATTGALSHAMTNSSGTNATLILTNKTAYASGDQPSGLMVNVVKSTDVAIRTSGIIEVDVPAKSTAIKTVGTIVVTVPVTSDIAFSTNGVIKSASGLTATTMLETSEGPRPATSPLVLDAKVHLCGSGKLQSGRAEVPFGAERDLIASDAPYVVLITPTDQCNGVCVPHKSAEGFAVQELGGGTSDATFDWLVIAPKRHTLDHDATHPLPQE
ncbi:MAG: hypothetical protein AAF799_25645 [Myxococcota bacterium]